MIQDSLCQVWNQVDNSSKPTDGSRENTLILENIPSEQNYKIGFWVFILGYST